WHARDRAGGRRLRDRHVALVRRRAGIDGGDRRNLQRIADRADAQPEGPTLQVGALLDRREELLEELIAGLIGDRHLRRRAVVADVLPGIVLIAHLRLCDTAAGRA